MAATRAWLDTLVYDTFAIQDYYSWYWGDEGIPKEEIEKADAEGRLEQWLDEAEVVSKWSGCMLDEEGARLVAEKTEWVSGINDRRWRICDMMC